MVAEYGMSEQLGLVSYDRPRQSMFLPQGYSPGKNYSEAKAAQIDEAVSQLMEEAHQRVRKILSDKRAVLNELSALLSTQETVLGDDLRKMMQMF
jgi:cell division protease FtsH